MTREEYCKGSRERAYAERVGKVYGDYVVEEVEYNVEKRKQVWFLRCTHCGVLKVTSSWQNYVNGRSGHCKRCDRAGNTLIGCSRNGFKVKRGWMEEIMWVEVECMGCGKLQRATIAEYIGDKIECGCGKRGESVT